MDGEPVGDQQDLANSMNKHRAGDTVTITFYRSKRKMDVKVVLGEARERA
jgi:S1-C subfamily serine protease